MSEFGEVKVLDMAAEATSTSMASKQKITGANWHVKKMGNSISFLIPGSSKCVKCVPFHQQNLPKGRNFKYLEDPGI